MEHLAALRSLVPLNPRILGVVETCESISDDLKRLALLTNCHNLTGLHAVGSDVHHLAVNSDVLVVDELTSSSTGGGDTEAVNDVVETALEALKKNLTGNAAGSSSLVEEIAELLLEYTIGLFSLLLLGEHDTVFGRLATTTITGVAAIHTLVRVAEDVLTKLAAELHLGTCISCHILCTGMNNNVCLR